MRGSCVLTALAVVMVSASCDSSWGTTTSTLAPTMVEGSVLAGPTCPVEQPGQVCPPAPVAGTVVAIDGEGSTVASTETDATGHYSLGLPAGEYTLHVIVDGLFPTCPDTPITVRSGAPVTANIDCDTGIR